MSEINFNMQNYNYSRQEMLTHQTSTNGSQDFGRYSNYQDRSKSKRQEKSLSKKQSSQKQQSDPQYYEFTEVFVWGDDRWGQLGLYHQKLKKGNKDQIKFQLPKTCSFNILIQKISCGENHSAILTNQGHLYMMGSNMEGQLGIGDNCPDLLNKQCAGAPCLVDKLRDYKVINVECGHNYTFAVAQEKNQNFGGSNNQVVFAWGNNREGQLGIQTNTQFDLPARLHFFEPQNITIKQISAGLSHALFLTESGQVYATGSNAQGQLGIGQQYNQVIQPILIDSLIEHEIVQVSAGHHHSLFLTKNGEVLSCGNNQLCQLGILEVNSVQYLPVQIKTLQNYRIIKVEAQLESAAISSQGELFLWGTGVFGTYKTPQKILTISNPVYDVTLGMSLGVALDSKGLLWTWGQNQLGELGVGDQDSRIHPYPVLTLKGKKVTQIKCGGQFVVALGVNVKKEIPQLKLKQQRESSTAGFNIRTSSQIIRNSSQKSIGNRSLSKSKKKKNSSSSKMFRRDSINSLNKIYGGGINLNAVERLNSDAHSPRLSKESKLSKILKKKNSKSSVNKSKLQDSIPRSKPKLKVKKSSSKATQPFSGEETTIIKPGFLNQSCLVVKNKNKLALVNSYQQHQFTQNQTQMSPTNFSKNQQQNFDLNSSSQDLTNITDSHNTTALNSQQLTGNNNHQQNQPLPTNKQQQQQVMYIPQSLQQTHTNKEKLIKDLNTEIKQLRTENELLRKENRTIKQQMEQQEKHYEKQNLAQQHSQELQNLHSEIQRQENKVNKLKQERNDYKHQLESTEKQLTQQESINKDLREENQDFINQMQLIQDEYKELQDKYHQSQERNEEYEREIGDIQNEIMQVSQQSSDVERSLLEKLHSVNEKYQDALKQIEELNSQIKSDKKKLDNYEYSAKDTQYYVSAVEKENSFLRQEIEKVKYSKDKDQYGKFLQNLIPIRNSNSNNIMNKKQSYDNVNNDNFRQSISSSNNKQYQDIKSPFKDSTPSVASYNYDNYDKSVDILSERKNNKIKENYIQSTTTDEPQILLKSSVTSTTTGNTYNNEKNNGVADKAEKENDNNKDINELRMSYNQKLLKSLEKKTLNKQIR